MPSPNKVPYAYSTWSCRSEAGMASVRRMLECLESAEHPREQVLSVCVRPRVHHPKSDVTL